MMNNINCITIKKEIDFYKEKLNSAVKKGGITLVDQEIIELSQQLDELIVEYTKRCMKKTIGGEKVKNG